MANTYVKCYIHLIFSPKNRDALIKKEIKDELEKYITQVIQKYNHKLLAIYAMPDHIHILIGYNLQYLIPDLVEEIKVSTNKWIKEKKLTNFKFDWQNGYGAFSHSKSQLDTVIKYIRNQELHHKKRTFREEYLEILKKNNVDYKEDYLFTFFD